MSYMTIACYNQDLTLGHNHYTNYLFHMQSRVCVGGVWVWVGVKQRNSLGSSSSWNGREDGRNPSCLQMRLWRENHQWVLLIDMVLPLKLFLWNTPHFCRFLYTYLLRVPFFQGLVFCFDRWHRAHESHLCKCVSRTWWCVVGSFVDHL